MHCLSNCENSAFSSHETTRWWSPSCSANPIWKPRKFYGWTHTKKALPTKCEYKSAALFTIIWICIPILPWKMYQTVNIHQLTWNGKLSMFSLLLCVVLPLIALNIVPVKSPIFDHHQRAFPFHPLLITKKTITFLRSSRYGRGIFSLFIRWMFLSNSTENKLNLIMKRKMCTVLTPIDYIGRCFFLLTGLCERYWSVAMSFTLCVCLHRLLSTLFPFNFSL